jgi:NO-binding membrane sensor protein with MHYT domain
MSSPLRILLVTGTLLGLSVSALEFAKFYAEQFEYQPFIKIASILLIILIVYALYWGLKEIRDRFYEGTIKFSKAFLYGAGISFMAFLIVFLYLIIHYSYIDIEGLQRINERNAALTPLTHVLPASLIFSFSVFLYGIFLNLFVLMYVQIGGKG